MWDSRECVIPLHNEQLAGMSHLNTVAENKLLFSDRKFKNATYIRELHEVLGSPSVQDYTKAMSHRLIPKTKHKVVPVNIKNSEVILGLHLGFLQGKIKRVQPKYVVADYIAVPRGVIEVHRYLILCAGTFL